MANLINMIIAGITNRRIAAERNRAYKEAVRELESYTDAELMDLGIARCDIPYAVKHGYTERGSSDELLRCDCEQAVRELESYSDHDLDDLGLARSEIVHAVKYGRQDELRDRDFPMSECASAL